jgi:hypothetical protein
LKQLILGFQLPVKLLRLNGFKGERQEAKSFAIKKIQCFIYNSLIKIIASYFHFNLFFFIFSCFSFFMSSFFFVFFFFSTLDLFCFFYITRGNCINLKRKKTIKESRQLMLIKINCSYLFLAELFRIIRSLNDFPIEFSSRNGFHNFQSSF